MKNKPFKLFTFIFTLLAISASAQETTLKMNVRALLDNYEVALSSKSSSKIADCFHYDAFILPEGKQTVKGREEIMENFKGLETIDFIEKFIIEEVIAAGDYAIVQTKNIGKWKDPKTSQSGSFEVKGQMILKPDPKGDLKIYRYVYNGNGTN